MQMEKARDMLLNVSKRISAIYAGHKGTYIVMFHILILSIDIIIGFNFT